MVDFERLRRASEVNYFPVEDKAQLVKRTSADQVLKEFEDLAEFLINDGYFHIDTHDGKNHKTDAALAFLIEATKQLYEGDWKLSIEEIKQKITEIRDNVEDPAMAHKQTTWLLNQIIQNLYEKALAISSLNAKAEHDIKREVFLNRLFNQQKTIALLKETIKDNNEAVHIGGIHPTLIPNWYKEMVLKYKGKSEVEGKNGAAASVA